MRKDYTELGTFILNKCSQAPHIALAVYFYICAMGQLGLPQWQKRCFKVLQKVCEPTSDAGPNCSDLGID